MTHSRYITHTIRDTAGRKLVVEAQYVLDQSGERILPVIEAVAVEDVEKGFRLDDLAESWNVLDTLNAECVKAVLARI